MFLNRLVEDGCQLFILPSVKYEFTRMAKNREQLGKYNELLDTLGIAVYANLEKYIINNQMTDFLMLYNNSVNLHRSDRKAPSYTDSLLCLALYRFHKSNPSIKLMSANHSDMPQDFFDRNELIVIDTGKEIHTEGVYSFNADKIQSQIRKTKQEIRMNVVSYWLYFYLGQFLPLDKKPIMWYNMLY